MHLLHQAGARRRVRADCAPRRPLLRDAERVSVHERSRDGLALRARGRSRGPRPAHRARADDPVPGVDPGDQGRLRPRRVQRGREPRHRGRRRHRRAPPLPRRAALGGRHELHVRGGRGARAAREPRAHPTHARGGLRRAVTIDPGIFKAYDLRGLYPEQIDEDVAYRVGRAFARVLPELQGRERGAELRIVLGHDMRLHSPALAAVVSQGLVDEGCRVLDVGLVGTEMVYYAIGSRELDGGVSVTASHNPKAWAGFKLLREGALALSGDSGIPDVQREVESGDFGDSSTKGLVEAVDIYHPFQEHVLGFIDRNAIRPMKLVLDGGNGMAGLMMAPILDSFPVDQHRLYFQPDGEFPGHEPNPLLPENRQLIIDTVLERGAELGIAWDGDADRCFFVDDHGEFVPGDFMTALLAEAILSKEPGATILYDVRASKAVKDTVERAGGKALVNRVGHAFFKTRMRETGAAFGGEVSGHYYFRNFWCADSGTI